MSVKLEREAQEREEAMQQIREKEAKLNEANARVSNALCFREMHYLKYLVTHTLYLEMSCLHILKTCS